MDCSDITAWLLTAATNAMTMYSVLSQTSSISVHKYCWFGLCQCYAPHGFAHINRHYITQRLTTWWHKHNVLTLAKCPFIFSVFVLGLCILSGQTKTFHILLNTISQCLNQSIKINLYSAICHKQIVHLSQMSNLFNSIILISDDTKIIFVKVS